MTAWQATLQLFHPSGLMGYIAGAVTIGGPLLWLGMWREKVLERTRNTAVDLLGSLKALVAAVKASGTMNNKDQYDALGARCLRSIARAEALKLREAEVGK